jgi:type II secretory pathway component PulK
MTPDERTYNGWTNYETWAVKLWMDNEEPSQRHWRERAEKWSKEPSTSEVWTQDESARFNLAGELRDYHNDRSFKAIRGNGASLYSELLRSALSEVYWTEIAASLLDDLDES